MAKEKTIWEGKKFGKGKKGTEEVGFEPTVRGTDFCFQDRRIRPLCHSSIQKELSINYTKIIQSRQCKITK